MAKATTAKPKSKKKVAKAVKAVAKSGWLPAGGWMAIETHRGDAVSPPEGWAVDTERDVGRARLTLLRS